MKKILLAFDFDHTIVDDNSDTFIKKLLQDGKVPSNLHKVYKQSGWTVYMQELFKILHQQGIKKEDYVQCIQKIPLTPSMHAFLNQIDHDKVDCIIISDSNTEFINYVLENYNCAAIFDSVFTNPASFDDEGLLNIKMFHEQDWCKLSEVNMCKGTILHDYIEKKSNESIEYTHIGYIGDGTNDFCPSLCLKQQDIVFPRVGYKLINNILDQREKGIELSCSVFPWDNGIDILEVVKQWVKTIDSDEIPANPRLLPFKGTK